MRVGDKVYTVNAKTNTIDEWTVAGSLHSRGELLIHVTRGKEFGFLPARCVFATEAEARTVLEK